MTEKPPAFQRPETPGEVNLLRFLLVGASGLVVNSSCLWLFVEAGGLHYLIAALLATQCSTLWNFILTEIWVFKEREPARSLLGRLTRFYVMNNLALILRGPLLALMVLVLRIHYLAANLASLFVMAVTRYLLSSKWIWVPSPAASDPQIDAYDIHGIIAIESSVPLPELAYFLVPELNRPPDIRLRTERRKHPRPSDRAIRYQDGLGKVGFELSIALGECTEIQVSNLVMRSPHVLYTNVFEPLLRWTFVRKGYALIHAACLAPKRRGLLITAKTDTGKTTTVLRALEKWRFPFLSDDMTILGRDGNLLNFPKPLTISAHTLRALRNVRLTLRERLMLLVQSRLHSRPGRKIGLWLMHAGLPAATINALVQILVPPPKYRVERLIPEVSIFKRVRLKHIVEIERGREGQVRVALDEMVERLIQNAEDAYGFPPYPELRSRLSSWKGEDLHRRERRIILEAVQGCQAWRLSRDDHGWWHLLPQVISVLPVDAHPAERALKLHELDTQPTRS